MGHERDEGRGVQADNAIAVEERAKVALANLRCEGFNDLLFVQAEQALASAHDEARAPVESLGRLTGEQARIEKRVLEGAMVAEAGRQLFGRDEKNRVWAVGRIDIGVGPWPRLGIVFSGGYPEACPGVFVFGAGGSPLKLPLGIEEAWDPRGGCRHLLQEVVSFLRRRAVLGQDGRSL